MKNVKEYVKQVNIYIKSYKVRSNKNVKPNNERIYETNKCIEMCIKIYVYKHKNKQI